MSTTSGAPGSSPSAAVRLGTQGWNYDAWVGPFYPSGTRAGDFLGLYARAFDTVEVDSTFYAVPAERTVLGWAERTPAHFRFALKLPQAITHEARLRDADAVLALFLERARLLGAKLGPVLVQLGPDFGPDELPALVGFLPRLPPDVRFAVEFRQRAWVREDVLALLGERGVALVLTDGPWVPRRWALRLAERFADQAPGAAPFAYVRWMGPDRTIVDHSRVQADRTRELAAWAAALGALATGGCEVYGYVSNYFAGHAPENARDVQRLLGQRPIEPDTLGDQLTLL